MITVSVPGKVHLMGEHAVVYGRPALLTAVNRRLTVTVSDGTDTTTGYVKEVLGIVRKHLRVIAPMKVAITSDIPAGFHLGSSAAVAVGVVAAASYYYKKIWNPPLFNQLAYEAEKIAHGTPSGADNTTVTMGGFIWYRKELEFLRSIWQLPLKLPKLLDHFFLIDTGRPKETTGEMVAEVNANFKLQTLKFERLFDENEKQTRRVAVALKEGTEDELIDAIRTGERTLEGMGVVSKKVTPLIRSIEQAGGAAKILGGGGRAGGVGFLLGYHHQPKPWNGIPIRLGEEGIRLEERD